MFGYVVSDQTKSRFLASRGEDSDQSAPPEESYGGGGAASGPEISDEDIPF